MRDTFAEFVATRGAEVVDEIQRSVEEALLNAAPEIAPPDVRREQDANNELPTLPRTRRSDPVQL